MVRFENVIPTWITVIAPMNKVLEQLRYVKLSQGKMCDLQTNLQNVYYKSEQAFFRSETQTSTCRSSKGEWPLASNMW